MSCTSVVELLPWLLNGTLEPEERSRVVGHLAGCEACRRELAETLVACRAFAQHPTTGELVDLVFDRPLADRALVEQHLTACNGCAEQVALLRQARVFEADGVVPLAPPRAAATAGRWRALAIAASVVAVVAAGGWLRSARMPLEVTPAATVAGMEAGPVAELVAGRLPVVEFLTPASALHRNAQSTAGQPIFELRPGEDLVLELEPPFDLPPFPAYFLVLSDGAGREVASYVRPRDRFAITVPAELLASGDYVVDLFGLRGGQRQGKPLDHYRLAVVVTAP